MAIIKVKDRNVLDLALEIRGIHFSSEQLNDAKSRTGDADIGRFIDSIDIWTDKSRTETSAKAAMTAYETVPKAKAQKMAIRINDPSLRKLFLTQTPKRLLRPFSPPYDNPNQKKNTKREKNDWSTDYNIVFPDSVERNKFIKGAKKLKSVVNVRKPANPKYIELDSGSPPL